MSETAFWKEEAGAIVRCQLCGGPMCLTGSEPHPDHIKPLLTYFCATCDEYQALPAQGREHWRHRLAATVKSDREYLSQVHARLKLTYESIEQYKAFLAYPVAAGRAQRSSGADGSYQAQQFRVPPSVASVFITDELGRRRRSRHDYLGQTAAMKQLARQMAERPDFTLSDLIDLAMKLCGAISGGISLYEPNPAPGVFRWHHVRGTLARFSGNAVPRDFSPCGVVIDENAAMLVQRPERVYTWLQEARVSLPECLLVPLFVGDDELVGTLWIVSHSEGHFDASHCEALSELAVFAGISLKMIFDRKNLKEALEQQKMLTREMGHRVKNLFAIADSLVRVGARSGGTAKDLADRISGSLQALLIANSLVNDADEPSRSAEFDDIIRTILSPYDRGRFEIDGPRLLVGPRSRNSIAVIFHELATNAAKYGAMGSDNGRVSVTWTTGNNLLLVHWRETGGPMISEESYQSGFGTVLCDKTVRAMNGTISHDWQPDGLVVTLTLPLSRVAQ